MQTAKGLGMVYCRMQTAKGLGMVYCRMQTVLSSRNDTPLADAPPSSEAKRKLKKRRRKKRRRRNRRKRKNRGEHGYYSPFALNLASHVTMWSLKVQGLRLQKLFSAMVL